MTDVDAPARKAGAVAARDRGGRRRFRRSMRPRCAIGRLVVVQPRAGDHRRLLPAARRRAGAPADHGARARGRCGRERRPRVLPRDREALGRTRGCLRRRRAASFAIAGLASGVLIAAARAAHGGAPRSAPRRGGRRAVRPQRRSHQGDAWSCWTTASSPCSPSWHLYALAALGYVRHGDQPDGAADRRARAPPSRRRPRSTRWRACCCGILAFQERIHEDAAGVAARDRRPFGHDRRGRRPRVRRAAAPPAAAPAISGRRAAARHGDELRHRHEAGAAGRVVLERRAGRRERPRAVGGRLAGASRRGAGSGRRRARGCSGRRCARRSRGHASRSR